MSEAVELHNRTKELPYSPIIDIRDVVTRERKSSQQNVLEFPGQRQGVEVKVFDVKDLQSLPVQTPQLLRFDIPVSHLTESVSEPKQNLFSKALDTWSAKQCIAKIQTISAQKAELLKQVA